MPTAQPFPVLDTTATHVVIEIFGGDNNLSDYVLEDLREMQAGNRGPVVVLALTDYADKGASVVELSPRTGTRELASLGEINTGDPTTLINFLTRALLSYPEAKRRAIGFWDHGSGIFDEFDPQARSIERALGRPARWARGRARPARKVFAGALGQIQQRAMLHDDTNAGLLTNREAGKVLASAFRRAKSGPVDMIFSDTCLNGMVEVLAELAPFAEVIVGSEDLEPGDGWDYALWFERMSDAAPQNGEQWGKLAVEAFGDSYRDRTSEHPVTLGAYRTGAPLVASLAAFVATLSELGAPGFDWVERARGKAQAFALRDTYDLSDFMAKLRAITPSAALAQACDAVLAAHESARVAAVAYGDRVRDAQGLALFIPANRYALQDASPTYRQLAFEKQTGWLAYLTQYR